MGLKTFDFWKKSLNLEKKFSWVGKKNPSILSTFQTHLKDICVMKNGIILLLSAFLSNKVLKNDGALKTLLKAQMRVCKVTSNAESKEIAKSSISSFVGSWREVKIP